MNRIMRIEEIMARLEFMSVASVARATSLSYQTVDSIKYGRNTNPVYRVLVALSDFLDKQMQPTISTAGGDGMKGVANGE